VFTGLPIHTRFGSQVSLRRCPTTWTSRSSYSQLPISCSQPYSHPIFSCSRTVAALLSIVVRGVVLRVVVKEKHHTTHDTTRTTPQTTTRKIHGLTQRRNRSHGLRVNPVSLSYRSLCYAAQLLGRCALPARQPGERSLSLWPGVPPCAAQTDIHRSHGKISGQGYGSW